MIDFLKNVFQENAERDAIVWRENTYCYKDLLGRLDSLGRFLEANGIKEGAVVAVEADFSPNAIALLLALIEKRCIIVPLANAVADQNPAFMEIAQVGVSLKLVENDEVQLARTGRKATHELYVRLVELRHPGLVLFSSGSTGKSKAAVHDLLGVLNKFKVRRHARRAIAFLLYDHIGGLNTMLYQLSNGGCIVTVPDRGPDTVLRAIQQHRVDMLPTSPTFLNLILLSEAHTRFDLSSLKLVTYGTEPMPEYTLRRFHEVFPGVQLQQTYGLSEIGILRSKSLASDSLWVKIGGEGFETRVVEGLLEVKAESAMLGYLNAPSPFTQDGWFKTGDAVQTNGEWMRILGRRSEIINVGGEKVYHAEVESVLQEIEGVEEASVTGEPNAITGNIVTATVRLGTDEAISAFRKRMWEHCANRLPRYKIPQKLVLTKASLASVRFKRAHRVTAGE